MSQNEQNVPEDLQQALKPMQRQIRWLTVVVIILAMFLALTAMAIFGTLIDYFAGDATLFGSATVGAALLGFGFGWMARRSIADGA